MIVKGPEHGYTFSININCILMNELGSDDVTAMKMTTKQDGLKKFIIVVSAYFPYNLIREPQPSEGIPLDSKYAPHKDNPIIAGCYTNAIWRNTVNISRGIALL